MKINEQDFVPQDEQPETLTHAEVEVEVVQEAHEPVPGADPVVDPPRVRHMGGMEALVALAIVVSLAGITVPIVGGKLVEGRLETATADMQRIVDGIRAYSNDTLFLPTGDHGRTDVAWLQGAGELPQGADRLLGQIRDLDDVLSNDSMGGSDWQGPYGDDVADPWGHAYVLHVGGLVQNGQAAWVLSAGPDGVLNTFAGDRKAVGDDLLLPIN